MAFEVLCQDGIRWCSRHKNKLDAVVTSIPEMTEVEMNEKDYIRFFRRASSAVLETITQKGYAIFIQTDRKHNGLIDKSYLLTDEAYKQGFRVMFHKIALIKGVDMVDLHKPTYSHMMCFSKEGTPGAATPDVIHRGKSLYKHGAGINSVSFCLSYLKNKGIEYVVDPFVGQGTTLIIAQRLKFKGGIGIDIEREQCDITAKNLEKFK
jgi:tRNA G10  N-methylase Trm11